MSRRDGLHQERNDNFLRPPAPRVTSVRSTNLTLLAPEEVITSGGPQTETRTLGKGRRRCVSPHLQERDGGWNGGDQSAPFSAEWSPI
ncbi:hypothetical protein ROHU_021009 [Labeo rohita]|uniref:Uncharacterized protein n=1 Tax=Labeo rohita TaxID=84645 RepID=A0A498NAA5_LABRO|nr:hypothetical protein ROHU_021009 [Labeo rohita]